MQSLKADFSTDYYLSHILQMMKPKSPLCDTDWDGVNAGNEENSL